jgi:hypothetical protein
LNGAVSFLLILKQQPRGQQCLDPQLALCELPDAHSLGGLLKYRLSDNGFPFSLTLFLSRDPISSLIEFG